MASSSKRMGGIQEARSIVRRQITQGAHEQDRWDAYRWWLRWGDGSVIHRPPSDPTPKAKRR